MTLKIDKNVLGLLYLISKAEGGFSQRIRLQKMVLLAKYEFGFDFTYSYSSYYYGPYSRDLQREVSSLINEGILEEVVEAGYYGTPVYNYKLTTKGEGIVSNFNIELRSPIDQVWEKYSTASTDFVVKSAKEVSNIKSLNE